VFTLHLIDGGDRGLEDATLSIGLLDPHPAGDRLRVYDFGLARLQFIASEQIIAVGVGEPARVTYVPDLYVEAVASAKMAANAKVTRLPVRRKYREVPAHFVSGYDTYARNSALYWRDHGVGTQPTLAAGVFSLSSIRTNIKTTLKLFSLLAPHVLVDELPDRRELAKIVTRAGAGFHSTKTGRPAWFAEFESYRYEIVEAINSGLRDDALRRFLAMVVPMPLGLGLAKLSFTLALIGNNLGCLDARILEYAFTSKTRKKFEGAVSKSGRNYGARAYDTYRSAELRILKDSPFFDPDDPVGLARAQWMLWESLGPETAREHTHEEMFRAVLEPAWLL
jgi:hypothetical protein